MASGFGYSGGRSRCFEHWQEFQKCYSQANFPSDCVSQKDDYLECLHHKKEAERIKTIRDTYIHRTQEEAKHHREKGDIRATSSVLRLGIIGQEEGDSKSDSDQSSPSDKQ